MNAKISTSLLSFFVSISIYAQKNEYIVTFSNDTLYGKIRSIGTQVRIKQDDGTKKIEASDVKLLYTDWIGGLKALYGKYIQSTKKIEFLELVVDGRISLYEQAEIVPKGGYAYYLYAQKDSGEVKLVSTKNVMFGNKKKQKEEFALMLSDQKELRDQFIAEDQNKLETIRKYIQLYNQQ